MPVGSALWNVFGKKVTYLLLILCLSETHPLAYTLLLLPCGPAMLRSFQKRLLFTQLVLLAVFFGGLGAVCVYATVVVNPVQRQWQIFCFAWELLAIGVPSVLFQPLFRILRPYLRRLDAVDTLASEEAARYHRILLWHPTLVGILCVVGSLGAYGVAALQLRYFAGLPWDGCALTIASGGIAGLMWGLVDYFVLDQMMRPLTELCPPAVGLPGPRRVPFALKIFTLTLNLVLASLALFGILAYSRAVSIVEGEVADSLTLRMKDLSLMLAELPRDARGGISPMWWGLSAEYRLSPNGYFHHVDS